MTTVLVMVNRSSFLALPGRVSTELDKVEEPVELSEKLKKEIYSILEDLSNYEYDPEEYRKRDRERRGWLLEEQEEES